MRQLYILFFVLSTLFSVTSCAGSKKIKNPSSVEEAEKAMAKKNKQEAKDAVKYNKAAQKAHYDRQSKAYKKSLKNNKKRNKKMMKRR